MIFPWYSSKNNIFFFKTFHDDMSKHREVVILAHIWLLLINNYLIPPSEPIFRNAVWLPGGPSLPFHLGQILLGLAKINRTMMINTRQLLSLYRTPSRKFRQKKHLHSASCFKVIAFDTLALSITSFSEEINILLSQNGVKVFASTWKSLI